jgi:hypothetical protein
MKKLRLLGLIKTRRGEIEILKPEELKKCCDEVLWI